MNEELLLAAPAASMRVAVKLKLWAEMEDRLERAVAERDDLAADLWGRTLDQVAQDVAEARGRTMSDVVGKARLARKYEGEAVGAALALSAAQDLVELVDRGALA